jgi:Flp pilus assembly protein CpaB
MTQSHRESDAVALAAPERVSTRRSVGSRFSTGHVVMVVSGLLGLLLSLSVLRRADNTVPVVVVTRDVVPGTRLRADMVGTTRVHADARSLSNLVAADDRDRMIGSIVLSSLRAGDLLERSGVGAASTGRAARSVSFPVDASLAVGGEVAAGDRIDVLAAAHDGSATGYVLVAADVVAVHAIGSGPLRGSDGQLSITVTVDAAGAQRLVAALHAADLLVVRSTGSAPVASVHWFDAGAGDG